MRHSWQIVAIAALAILSACKDRPSSRTETAPVLEPPILYLNGSSGSEEVTISVNGKVVWNKIVPMGSLLPNIHAVKIDRGTAEECEISLESKSLREGKKFSWADGLFFTINFNNYKNGMIMQQKDAPRFL